MNHPNVSIQFVPHNEHNLLALERPINVVLGNNFVIVRKVWST